MLITINITSFAYTSDNSGQIDFSADITRSDDPSHIVSITPLTGGEYTGWDLETKQPKDTYKLIAEACTTCMDNAWGSLGAQEYNYVFLGLSINGPLHFSIPELINGTL